MNFRVQSEFYLQAIIRGIRESCSKAKKLLALHPALDKFLVLPAMAAKNQPTKKPMIKDIIAFAVCIAITVILTPMLAPVVLGFVEAFLSIKP
jgi:hypothetical protein